MRWTGIPVCASGGGGGGGGRGSVCEGRRRIAISPTASNIPLLAEELGRLPLTSKSYSLEVK